jgi:hypothetical protein
LSVADVRQLSAPSLNLRRFSTITAEFEDTCALGSGRSCAYHDDGGLCQQFTEFRAIKVFRLQALSPLHPTHGRLGQTGNFFAFGWRRRSSNVRAAAMRASEESAMRAHAQGQTKAQRQQRIQDAAAKRTIWRVPIHATSQFFPAYDKSLA